MNKKSGTSKAAADRLVKTIRRKTRQTYSSEEKIRIVLAGLRGEETISVLCRLRSRAICQSFNRFANFSSPEYLPLYPLCFLLGLKGRC